MPFLLRKILFVLLCLALPVLWGVLVNWLFNLWEQKNERPPEEPIFPDYQI